MGQVDRRDPSGQLPVRVRNQPATGETEDGSLLAVIAGYRALPGAGPADSGAAVLTVHDHATGLRVWTHIGPEAG